MSIETRNLIAATNRGIEIAELGRKDGLVTHTVEQSRALVSAIESLTAERDRLREAVESVLKGTLMADGINRDGTGLTFEISMGDFDPNTKKWLLSIEKKLQEALS